MLRNIASRVARIPRRSYSSSSSGHDGAIREGRDAFASKEKALENQWARKADADKIKLLREQLEKTKKELEIHQERLAELEKNHKK
ncbi:uncharacterized protein VTP21DRAFT_8445 [Calcarisporiella thermophila]|uniref:uncharacterized protein n=1 Tax=Calcarisporiella thermophila TaxID=911321 RepID=UPI003742DCB5